MPELMNGSCAQPRGTFVECVFGNDILSDFRNLLRKGKRHDDCS